MALWRDQNELLSLWQHLCVFWQIWGFSVVGTKVQNRAGMIGFDKSQAQVRRDCSGSLYQGRSCTDTCMRWGRRAGPGRYNPLWVDWDQGRTWTLCGMAGTIHPMPSGCLSILCITCWCAAPHPPWLSPSLQPEDASLQELRVTASSESAALCWFWTGLSWPMRVWGPPKRLQHIWHRCEEAESVWQSSLAFFSSFSLRCTRYFTAFVSL